MKCACATSDKVQKYSAPTVRAYSSDDEIRITRTVRWPLHGRKKWSILWPLGSFLGVIQPKCQTSWQTRFIVKSLKALTHQADDRLASKVGSVFNVCQPSFCRVFCTVSTSRTLCLQLFGQLNMLNRHHAMGERDYCVCYSG